MLQIGSNVSQSFKIEFMDLDNDGDLDIIEKRVTETVTYKKKDDVQTITNTSQRIYSLQNETSIEQ